MVWCTIEVLQSILPIIVAFKLTGMPRKILYDKSVNNQREHSRMYTQYPNNSKMTAVPNVEGDSREWERKMIPGVDSLNRGKRDTLQSSV